MPCRLCAVNLLHLAGKGAPTAVQELNLNRLLSTPSVAEAGQRHLDMSDHTLHNNTVVPQWRGVPAPECRPQTQTWNPNVKAEDQRCCWSQQRQTAWNRNNRNYLVDLDGGLVMRIVLVVNITGVDEENGGYVVVVVVERSFLWRKGIAVGVFGQFALVNHRRRWVLLRHGTHVGHGLHQKIGGNFGGFSKSDSSNNNGNNSGDCCSRWNAPPDEAGGSQDGADSSSSRQKTLTKSQLFHSTLKDSSLQFLFLPPQKKFTNCASRSENVTFRSDRAFFFACAARWLHTQRGSSVAAG